MCNIIIIIMYILSNTKDMFMKYTFYHLKKKVIFFTDTSHGMLLKYSMVEKSNN